MVVRLQDWSFYYGKKRPSHCSFKPRQIESTKFVWVWYGILAFYLEFVKEEVTSFFIVSIKGVDLSSP